MHGGCVLRKVHLEALELSFWNVMHVEEGEVEEGRERGWELKKGGEGERMWEVKKKQRRRRKVVLRKVLMLGVEREGIGLSCEEFGRRR